MFLAVLLSGSGCGDSSSAPAGAAGRVTVRSGLPPVAWIASRIGGEYVDSKSMLPEGRSPHDYSPKPHDVLELAGAKLFFITRLQFEKRLAQSLREAKTRVVDVTGGAEWIPFDGCGEHGDHHSHDDHDDDHDDHDGDHGETDPHLWLSLKNDAVIARNICGFLCETDPEHAGYYRKNLETLLAELDAAEAYAVGELAPYRGREFFVYHPAFGYFGRMTGLRQVAVELDGREATPAHLLEIIDKARRGRVRVIFVQPQFNPGSAKALADAVHGEVAELDPLAGDVIANVHKMVEALKRGFGAERSPTP